MAKNMKEKINVTTQIIIPPESIDEPKYVRRQVFQMEQKIATEIDYDDLDDSAIHIIARNEETQEPIGTARARIIAEGLAKIERVATLSASRGSGAGTKVMEGLHTYLAERGITKTTLDAQTSAKDFYLRLGYEQVGDVFEEAGIDHVVMTKNIQKGEENE